MNLSNPQRAKKLVLNLLRNPELFGPYVYTNIISRRTPIELGYAWWSFLAIKEMDQLVSGKTIFEYGLGGSTIRWSAQAKHWTGIEHDSTWLDVVKKAMPENKESGATKLHLSTYRFATTDVAFEESDYLLSLNRPYDGILIDGMDVSGNERICCFHRAEKFIQPGGFIVVDDFWRYQTRLEKHEAREVQIFESVGPCRWGVTSTAIFYY